MPRGPLPDPGAARRNQPELPVVELGPAVGEAGAPELPNADRYSEATLAWYATWCNSPQTSQFAATDWQRLHMLAPLINTYFDKPTSKDMVEIRLNEKQLGALVGDRLALRWRLPQPKTPPTDDEPSSKPSRERPDPRSQ